MSDTFMAREVAEIPACIAALLARNADAVAGIGAELRADPPQLVITVARGSSDHAAAYLKYACEILTGVPVASVGPSVASVYGAQLRLPRSLCLAISQSGQSPDILAMVRAAATACARTLAVTNHPDAPLGRGSDHCLALHCGAERSVAATKTFVNSVVAGLALLADWAQNEGLRAALARLPDACAQALTPQWGALSDRLARAPALYVLGRGPGYAIACESALKFKETSALHAEAYSAAEVLHGPAAIVERGFPVLALVCDDAARAGFLETAVRLAGQGADVFVTDPDAGGAAARGGSARPVALPVAPPLHPLLDPLLRVVSFYVFIEALARRRGLDPDRPRHLQKVTQTL